MRELTPLLIVALVPGLGLLDYGLYRLGGNEATFSKVMLDARLRQPLVALLTAYSVGVMLGHFFLPTTAPAPPPHETVGRALCALSFTIYGLIIIWADNGGAAAHKRALEAGGHAAFAGYMLAAVVVGGLVGALVLPQHLDPT